MDNCFKRSLAKLEPKAKLGINHAEETVRSCPRSHSAAIRQPLRSQGRVGGPARVSPCEEATCPKRGFRCKKTALTPLEKKGKPLFVVIYRGIIILGILRWCETGFAHQHVDGRHLGFFGNSDSFPQSECSSPTNTSPWWCLLFFVFFVVFVFLFFVFGSVCVCVCVSFFIFH